MARALENRNDTVPYAAFGQGAVNEQNINALGPCKRCPLQECRPSERAHCTHEFGSRQGLLHRNAGSQPALARLRCRATTLTVSFVV